MACGCGKKMKKPSYKMPVAQRQKQQQGADAARVFQSVTPAKAVQRKKV